MSPPVNLSVLAILLPLNIGIVVGQEFSAARGDAAIARPVPPGIGQLETPPALFKGGVDERGRAYFLNGQLAQEGKLVLTASNGFFDSGTCRAGGESELPKVGDDDLIAPNFASLGQWKETQGTIRWHVWLPRPGTVRLNVDLRVPNGSAGSKLTISLAGDLRTVTTSPSSSGTPQPWELVFDVAEPGEQTITFSADKIADPQNGVGELHTIELDGPAINDAQLLRARWRPAAVHGGYSCSTIKQSRMWVMSTRSSCDFGSYSPITTPFGYFGTSFTADRRSNGQFNFSMWAAGARGKVPPLDQMPHLLAAGSPEAEFSGFGHEGSGVKLRGWTPMPDKPEVCVQALRVESGGKYDTYHGYHWDHPSRRWKLYAVGRKWNGGRAKANLLPGSFCEIPGPPHVQRSGDQVREVRRRGWCCDAGNTWHPMDTFDCKSKGPFNKFWYTTSDGEFAMGTGGMRYYPFEQPSAPAANSAQPEYLTPAATKQLYELPADVQELKANGVAKGSVRLNLLMTRAGANARAEVYYGESDCLTFARRELHGTERKSAVSQSTQADDRSWSNVAEIKSLSDGSNPLTLDGLKPGTTYYARALVTNDDGRVWMFDTMTFHTSR